MPLEREVLLNQAKAREKLLCVFGLAKAAHARRKSLGGCDPHVRASVDDCPQLGLIWVAALTNTCFTSASSVPPLGCRVAAQLIGPDLARYWIRAQYAPEKAFGRSLLPNRLAGYNHPLPEQQFFDVLQAQLNENTSARHNW
jgi:hypothetical protein